MKYIKSFNENLSIYNPLWEKLLPETITVLNQKDEQIEKLVYQKGNVMLNADMLQISYDLNKWSEPDTFEIDIYLVRYEDKSSDLTKIVKSGVYSYDTNSGKYIPNLRLDIDITFGDQMACEFSIDKNGVKLLQYTSLNSKFDPSNTFFGIEESDLQKLIGFFNRFNHGFNLSIDDLYFLR